MKVSDNFKISKKKILRSKMLFFIRGYNFYNKNYNRTSRKVSSSNEFDVSRNAISDSSVSIKYKHKLP